MTEQEKIQEKIQGAINSLFFFDSKVSQLKKEEIAKWFLSLTKHEKNIIEILIQESRDETEYFSDR